MDERPEAAESNEESLAAMPPCPTTEPPAPAIRNLGLNAAILTAAGAGALFLIGGTMTPCVGATRSTKLHWEQRQREIEQAARDANSCDSEQP